MQFKQYYLLLLRNSCCVNLFCLLFIFVNLRQLRISNYTKDFLYYIYRQSIAKLLFVNIKYNNSKLKLIIKIKYLSLQQNNLIIAQSHIKYVKKYIFNF